MIYRFGECELDTERHALYRGGEPISVGPKVFQILVYLIDHRGRAVSYDELLAQCWPGRFVSTDSIRKDLSRVRRAIGQRKGQAEFIQTISKKGYRFIGEVNEQPTPRADAAQAVAGESSATPPQPPRSGDTPLAVSLELTDELSATALPPLLSEQPKLPSLDAERRQLTVLECTLRYPESANPSLDLEKQYEVQQLFSESGRAIIEAGGGQIVGFTKNGLIAYFGYPQAQEDTARRAVRSSLRLIEALQTLGLASSIGIDTGIVVIETTSTCSPLVSGETPALASYLCAHAARDSIVMSPATSALVAGYFDWRAWPEHATTPSAYRVVRERSSPSRLHGASGMDLTAFVGREAELALLQARWREACEGQGQVVLLSGEAGIGKSRLIKRLKQQIADAAPNRVECHSSPYHQNTAFYPLIDVLQRALQQQAPSEASELERLETLLRRYQLTPQTDAPPLAALLSLALPEERYAPLTTDSQQLRQQVLQTLLKLLLAQSVEHPLLFIIEDLHWADPSTLELIEQLIVQAPLASVMSVLSCRPDFMPPWVLQAAVTPIALKRFDQDQIEQMLEDLTDRKQLPVAVLQQIAEKTDGVPLFIEELTRALLESAQLIEHESRYELTDEELRPLIPATLQDSLMARLDRLSSDKLIAQWAAALGREFSFEMLAAVTAIDEPVLREGLDELVTAGLIYQLGLPPQARYLFKHALVRDAAYQSLLKQQRRHMHGQIAQVLSTQFVELKRQQPELLARHYTEADLKEQAIEYWRQAGERSAERSAHQEVVSHFTAGLKLLADLPSSRARDQREFDLLLNLGPSLMVVKGQAAIESETAYTRADQLCDQLGETAKRFPVLWGLWRIHLNRPDMHTAYEKTQPLLALAAETRDTGLLVEAHLAAGMTAFYGGRFKQAREQMEQGTALYDLQQHQGLATRYGGYDPAVVSRSFLANALWILGYPEQAAHHGQRALEQARKLSQPYTLAAALYFANTRYLLSQEHHHLRQAAQEQITICKQQGFSDWLATGQIYLGWALMATDPAQRIQQILQGVSDITKVGNRFSLWSFVLGAAYFKDGQIERGLQTVDEALGAVEETGYHILDALLFHLKGELLQAQIHSFPVTSAAIESVRKNIETCYQQALVIARRQQAKAFELRIAVSLARWWQSREQREAACELLAPIYGWFQEGFDTVDLQQAQMLLQQLDDS